MSGWSAAHVTINDDDQDPNNPPTGDPTPQITAFNPAGTPVGSESCAGRRLHPHRDLGFVGRGGLGDDRHELPEHDLRVLYSRRREPLRRNRRRDGDVERPAGRGSPYYLVLYACAADPIDDQSDDTEVSATFHWSRVPGADSSFATTSAFVNFKPLQMYNNASEVGGARYSGNLKVAIGQMINLQVKDPSGTGGIVQWSMPGGTTVKNYQPTTPSKLTYLSNLDLLSFAAGGNLSLPPLSFAWVAGGTGGIYRESHALQPVFQPIWGRLRRGEINVIAPASGR